MERALDKELVAFSNLEGGMVIPGVENDGTITGLNLSIKILSNNLGIYVLQG